MPPTSRWRTLRRASWLQATWRVARCAPSRCRRRVARRGCWQSSDYPVPVNADVGSVEVIMLSEVDAAVIPAGVKAAGSLATSALTPQFANAVFHATGARLRTLPIRLEDLLASAPDS